MVEVDGRDYIMLDGNEHARYLLPIDYPPSYDYRARWGYSHPPLSHFEEWYQSDIEKYKLELSRLGAYRERFQMISEYAEASNWEPGWFGGAINAIDSAMIYHFVASRRPGKFVEIGSGMSTRFARRAISDHDLETQIICIDPAPRMDVSQICDEHIELGLEQCSLDAFTGLQPNDIVFFDGSHRTFANSDVTVFFLEIVPALRPGVIVHVHDIVWPLDYPPSFLDWYWNEQYIVGAYLIGARPLIEMLMPTAFIRLREDLVSALPPKPYTDANPDDAWQTGGSVWFTHRE